MKCNCFDCFAEVWNNMGEYICKEHIPLFKELIEKLNHDQPERSKREDVKYFYVKHEDDPIFGKTTIHDSQTEEHCKVWVENVNKGNPYRNASYSKHIVGACKCPRDISRCGALNTSGNLVRDK